VGVVGGQQMLDLQVAVVVVPVDLELELGFL
jgi:hypothetical protein